MQHTNFIKNVFLNLSGQILPALIGLVAVPFLIRNLGAEEFGILALAYTILISFTLFDFGMSRATTYSVSSYLAKNQTEILTTMVWTSLLTHVILGIVGGMLLFWCVPFLVEDVLKMSTSMQETAKWAFKMVAVAIPFILAHSVLRGVLEATGRFGLINLVKIPLNCLTFLLPVVLLSFNFGLISLINILLVLQVLASLSYLLISLYTLPWLKRTPSFQAKILTSLLEYGGWVTISAVISPILVYLDRFILGNLASISAVPFYVIPYEAVTRLWVVPSSLTIVLFPAFAMLKASRKEGLIDHYIRSAKYLLLIMGPIVIVLVTFSRPLLRIVLGQEFAMYSTRILQILAIGVLINSLAWIPYAFMQGTGRPDIPAKLHVIELPFHLIVAWFLIKKNGATGAAMAWTIRVTLDALLLYYLSFKTLNLSFTRLHLLIRNTLFVFACFSILIILVPLLGTLLIFQVIIVILLTSLYIFVLWKWMLDNADREAARHTVRNLTGLRESV